MHVFAVISRHWLASFLLTASLLSSADTATAVTKGNSLWMRLNGGAQYMQMDPRGNFIAYTNTDGRGLNILNIKSAEIFAISKHQVGQAFFFAPDGCRLFYREMYKNPDASVTSEVSAYDCALKKSISLAKLPHVTGLLSFDPRDMRLSLLHEKGIHTQRLSFPGERLARWQEQDQPETGKWVASQKGILWITSEGTKMRKMQDDGSEVQALDISPDGSSIVWATTSEQIYTSHMGRQPKLIGDGRDPRWHPQSKTIAFVAPRKLGKVTIDYDIKVTDSSGNGKFITATPGTPERWPLWSPDGKNLIWTRNNSTDLFKTGYR